VQAFLSKNISKFRPTTTLVVSSAAPSSSPSPSPLSHSLDKKSSPTKIDHPLQKFHNQISSHSKAVQFFTSMQHNLKTVQYGDNTLTSSFPTQDNINQAMDLMRRMGVDNSIIGVGNGAAIDLAKACYLNMTKNSDIGSNQEQQQQLVLIPSTLGGILASASKRSLILDVHEEALITSLLSTSSCRVDDVHVLVDTKSLAIPMWLNSKRNTPRGNLPTIVDALLASLVIAIDTQCTIQTYSSFTNENQQELIDKCLQAGVSCLQQILSSCDELNDYDSGIIQSLANNEVKESALHALFYAGQLLSFGDLKNDSLPRSMPLAMSSALLPKYFPHGNWMTFTGSFLPGLIQCMDEIDNVRSNMTSSNVAYLDWIQEELLRNRGGIIPSLSSLAEGAPDVNELVTKIDDNGALLRCNDGNIEFLERVLMSSLNR